jgi:hypothetical protein
LLRITRYLLPANTEVVGITDHCTAELAASVVQYLLIELVR